MSATISRTVYAVGITWIVALGIAGAVWVWERACDRWRRR